MECFNSLLVKLREVHDREVEGWQMKMQELSNKKGCDTKRMEELFSKNQQMKEQQRLLTENIKTLENRLRAGLCDRCTVTQDVAKRRQQEFEATHIQSLQHLSLLAGEINSLKKENKRLREEVMKLRTTVESHSEHSSSSTSATEVKPNSSPDLSPSSAPVALLTTAADGGSKRPADGDVIIVKSAPDHKSNDAERRQWKGQSRSNTDSHKHLSAHASAPWKTEHNASHNAEKRARDESVDQQAFILPLLPKTSSPPAGRELGSSRHVLHTPVPCRPQPIKTSTTALPWPLSESADWGSPAAPGSSLLVQPSSKLSLPRFPNLIPRGQHAGLQRQGPGPVWAWPNPKANTSEPTVLFRLRGLSDHAESPNKPQEKRENPVSKAEKVPEEVLKEVHDGPLDLSDRGKSKSSLPPKDFSPSALQGVERVQSSPNKDVKINSSSHGPLSSPHAVIPPSTSTSTAVKQHEDEAAGDQKHKVKKEQKDDVNVKTEPSNGKKVPVLTISLRPVVVLENLNSALQKQDSSNGKSSPAAETGSSFDEEEDESASGQESNQGCKRKRASMETDSDRESDTDNINQERKLKITVRSGEKSPG